MLWPPFYPPLFPCPDRGRAADGQAVSEETIQPGAKEKERQRGRQREAVGVMGGVKERGGGVCRLSISAVLVRSVGVDGAVWLLAVFARRHPLVYPVQAAGLLEVTDLPRGREAFCFSCLNGSAL